MITIKIFTDFCDSSKGKIQIEEYCRVYLLEFYGREKKVYITTEDTEYTHVLILNKAMPLIKDCIPRENVIGFAWEPPGFLSITGEFIEYAKKYIHKYFIGDVGNLPSPFIEQYGYMWYSHPSKPILFKQKLMSIIISYKQWTNMQKYRHIIVENILLNNLPIDIFGNGCHLHNQPEHENERIKGQFDNWSLPYEDYFFSICIENFQSNQYFSEKVISPLMNKCTPIYLGCPNIKNYIGDTMVPLSGNIVEDMNLIVKILQNPINYYKIIDTEGIDNKLNFIKNAENIYGV